MHTCNSITLRRKLLLSPDPWIPKCRLPHSSFGKKAALGTVSCTCLRFASRTDFRTCLRLLLPQSSPVLVSSCQLRELACANTASEDPPSLAYGIGDERPSFVRSLQKQFCLSIVSHFGRTPDPHTTGLRLKLSLNSTELLRCEMASEMESAPFPLMRLSTDIRRQILRELLWQSEPLRRTSTSRPDLDPKANFTFWPAVLRTCVLLYTRGQLIMYDNTFSCDI